MNIRAMRLAANLSQLQLATALGISQASVAGWESGISWPESRKLPALAKVLNCSIDDLFAKDGEADETN